MTIGVRVMRGFVASSTVQTRRKPFTSFYSQSPSQIVPLVSSIQIIKRGYDTCPIDDRRSQSERQVKIHQSSVQNVNFYRRPYLIWSQSRWRCQGHSSHFTCSEWDLRQLKGPMRRMRIWVANTALGKILQVTSGTDGGMRSRDINHQKYSSVCGTDFSYANLTNGSVVNYNAINRSFFYLFIILRVNSISSLV